MTNAYSIRTLIRSLAVGIPLLCLSQVPAAQAAQTASVGTDAAIQRYIGPSTRVVDLEGRLLIPGFIDAHAHFVEILRLRLMLVHGDNMCLSGIGSGVQPISYCGMVMLNRAG